MIINKMDYAKTIKFFKDKIRSTTLKLIKIEEKNNKFYK